MLEIDYVNNTHIVSLLPNMTAINSCIEVDLTGQVCADSIGKLFSFVGCHRAPGKCVAYPRIPSETAHTYILLWRLYLTSLVLLRYF